MRAFKLFVTFFLIFSLNTAVFGQGQEQKTDDSLLTLEGYLDMERVAGPQISPDGKQVIYTRMWVDKMNDRFDSALWIMNADGSNNRQLLKGAGGQMVTLRGPDCLYRSGSQWQT